MGKLNVSNLTKCIKLSASMGRIIKIELTNEQRKELEKSYRNGKSHTIRVRCQLVLLRSEDRKSTEIALFRGVYQQAVNLWLNRY